MVGAKHRHLMLAMLTMLAMLAPVAMLALGLVMLALGLVMLLLFAMLARLANPAHASWLVLLLVASTVA